MKTEQAIEIISPLPAQLVDTKFLLLGKVLKSRLLDGKYGLSVDWLTGDGSEMPMSGPNVSVLPTIFPWSKKARFRAVVDLTRFASSEHPRGLILVIEVSEGEQKHISYLPVIVKGTNPNFDSEHSTIYEKFSSAISEVIQNTESWKNYIDALTEIRKSLVTEPAISEEIFKILEQEEAKFEPIHLSETDEKVIEVQEKYRDAIQYHGPGFGGTAGKMDGYELRVYSDDHGQHFHVIHKGKGINARFSFPEIEPLSYVSKNIIGVKTIKKLQEFCKKPEVFAKLKEEFTKRGLAI